VSTVRNDRQENEARSCQTLQQRTRRQGERRPQQKGMFLLRGIIVKPDQRFDPAIRKPDRDLR
jgi:hypothetical protein